MSRKSFLLYMQVICNGKLKPCCEKHSPNPGDDFQVLAEAKQVCEPRKLKATGATCLLRPLLGFTQPCWPPVHKHRPTMPKKGLSGCPVAKS